ncbi:MAG: ATP-binding cassette domain-containing protein, partial [Bifidobacteriaceae bacterium]|nr:ATP-binding cassette domain-containing protein [Bifidobacteriaceae bacterium]
MNENFEHSTNIVSIEHVGFRRNRRPILQDVNLKIRKGENWVIFGANGIGKSTLISMLASRAFPTTGNAYIFGKRLGSVN